MDVHGTAKALRSNNNLPMAAISVWRVRECCVASGSLAPLEEVLFLKWISPCWGTWSCWDKTPEVLPEPAEMKLRVEYGNMCISINPLTSWGLDHMVNILADNVLYVLLVLYHYIALNSVLWIYLRHFLYTTHARHPITRPQGGMGCRSWVKIGYQSYHCNCCSLCIIVLYTTVIYRDVYRSCMWLIYSYIAGHVFLRRHCLIGIKILNINLTWSPDRLRFIMGIHVPVRRHFFS